MKTLLTAVLLSVFLVARAESQETPRVKVAVVSLQRIMGSGLNYDKMMLLSLDKATLEALKKVNAEIQEVQAQIVDVNDEVKLNDLGRRLEFLTRKSGLLRQRGMNNEGRRDYQSVLRKFVVDRFKDKYALIIQQDGGSADRILWRGAADVQDITDEVQDEFQKYIDDVVGDAGRPAKHRRPVAQKK